MAIIKFKQADGNWALVETAAALKYTEQTLTESQKLQSRLNLGLDIATDEEILEMFINSNVLYAVKDADGSILTDEQNNILLW